MRWLSQIAFYVKSLFLKKTMDAGLSEEIRLHLEMETEAKIAAGMPPDEARYAAQREFGNVVSIQEQARDERGWVWLEQLVKDFGFVLRSLARARGFSLTAIATLVVGISIAAVVFNLTNWILFRPLPFPEPERLVLIGSKDKANPIRPGCSATQFQAYLDQTKVFAEFAAAELSFANVVADGAPSTGYVVSASVDCFRTLGIKLAFGRGFRPEDCLAGAANVIVISDKFWREKFQASAEVLGRQFLVDDQAYTVIGVLAAHQNFPQNFNGDAYRRLVLKLDPAQPIMPWLTVIGRLKPGVTKEQATAALAAVKLTGLPSWAESYFAEMHPVLDSLSLIPTKPYWLMLAGGLLLYASACLNAMNLMTARLLGRQRELGIRLAMGGSRWQIARLLLIESMGLALAAGMAVAFAWRWLFPPLAVLLQGGDTVVKSEGNWWVVGWGTLGLAVGLSAIAGAAVALVPVWRLIKNDVNTALKEGGPGYGASRRMTRLRNGLVVLQAAFAVILLVGTGLMVRSFEKLRQVDLGFDPVGLVKTQVAFPRGYDPAPEAKLQLFERISQRLGTLPGVKGVTYGSGALLDGEWHGEQLKLPDGTIKFIGGHYVTADFARVAGLTLTKGQWFTARSGGNTSPTEVLINETMAREFFGDGDPLGRPIPGRPYVVVGVVHDVKGAMREPVGMHYYTHASKIPQNIRMVVLRMEVDPPKEFRALIQRAIYAVEPKLIVSNTRTIAESIGDSMWAEQRAYSVLKALTPIGLGLAAVGLFSILAYNVETRMKEFGVRLALGATPVDLQRLVLTRGVGIAAIGVLVGTVAALGLTRFMQSLLFETTPNDPLVLASVCVLLLTSAALACWLPARRAAKVDPVVALRTE